MLKDEIMKNLRFMVREDCDGSTWSPAIYDGKKNLGRLPYTDKKAAIRRAKYLSKRIGIKYDPEIIKQKGC